MKTLFLLFAVSASTTLLNACTSDGSASQDKGAECQCGLNASAKSAPRITKIIRTTRRQTVELPPASMREKDGNSFFRLPENKKAA